MIEVKGADEFARVARALKEAGDKGLQRELAQAVNRATRPVKAEIKRSAQTLPQRGGLAARVASTKLSTRKNQRGIRIVGKGTLSLWHLDQGIVRHRTRGGLVESQRITGGWWSKPTDAAAPEVRREISEALETVAAKIGRAA